MKGTDHCQRVEGGWGTITRAHHQISYCLVQVTLEGVPKPGRSRPSPGFLNHHLLTRSVTFSKQPAVDDSTRRPYSTGPRTPAST